MAAYRPMCAFLYRQFKPVNFTAIRKLCGASCMQKTFLQKHGPRLTACKFVALCYSTDKSSENLKNITDDILKAKQQEQPKEENAKTDSKKKESKWTGKNVWKLGLLSLVASGVFSGGVILTEWGAPALDAEGKEVQDEFSELPVWKQYPRRAWKEARFYTKMIQDPSSEKLLPDPLKEPYFQPPYTLVLEMTGVLVYPDWTLSTGWRFKKRPGLEYFLQTIGPPMFEIVVYTAEQGFTAYPLLNSLDPKGYIMYRLFRDATRWTQGHHVKDLDCLNRDLSKVIMIDHDKKSFMMHSRNGIALKKWDGSDNDKTLIDLANFLKTVAMSGVEDIRTVVDFYSQFDDPLEEFKKNQKKLQEEQEKQQQEIAEKQKHDQQTSSWIRSLTGRR